MRVLEYVLYHLRPAAKIGGEYKLNDIYNGWHDGLGPLETIGPLDNNYLIYLFSCDINFHFQIREL